MTNKLVWPGNKVVWNPMELEAAWYRANRNYVNQDVNREFESQDKCDKPEITFDEMGKELGVSKQMAIKIFKRAMRKATVAFESAGIDLDSVTPDPEASYQYGREIHELING